MTQDFSTLIDRATEALCARLEDADIDLGLIAVDSTIGFRWDEEQQEVVLQMARPFAPDQVACPTDQDTIRHALVEGRASAAHELLNSEATSWIYSGQAVWDALVAHFTASAIALLTKEKVDPALLACSAAPGAKPAAALMIDSTLHVHCVLSPDPIIDEDFFTVPSISDGQDPALYNAQVRSAVARWIESGAAARLMLHQAGIGLSFD